MKKQFICEYCNKIFDNENDCVHHEITHLDIDKKCTTLINNTILEVNKKYNCNSTLNYFKFDIYCDYNDSYKIQYTFSIKIDILKKDVIIEKTYNIGDEHIFPSVNELFDELDQRYFIPIINLKYEGIFRYEDWCGGNGADDYLIGEVYMDTIFKTFKNKRVRLEVIDE